MEWVSEWIRQHGVWVGLPVIFVGGLALNLTPCVYPMVPVTVAFFSAQAQGATRRIGWLAACYVLGLALSYATLGLLAALTGKLFGSWLQSPVVLVGTAAVLVALALSMFGVYELWIPQALLAKLGRAWAGAWGALGMGLVVGVVAAPCVGPFVAGLLALVSQWRQPAVGFAALFVLGLGMGTPMLVLALAARRIGRLPKAGAWMVWVKRAMGVVVLAVAVWMVRPLVPAWSGGRASGSEVAWVPYRDARLEEAKQRGRPALVDVYADWCMPCVEMDHVTFHDPLVLKALDGVVTLRVDATSDVPPEQETFLKRLRIYGAPTIVLFGRDGRERSELRLTGFEGPEEFLKRLRQIL